jgi:hypothetical protein
MSWVALCLPHQRFIMCPSTSSCTIHTLLQYTCEQKFVIDCLFSSSHMSKGFHLAPSGRGIALSAFSHCAVCSVGRPSQAMTSAASEYRPHHGNLMSTFIVIGLVNADCINPEKASVPIYASLMKEGPEVFPYGEVLIIKKGLSSRCRWSPHVR